MKANFYQFFSETGFYSLSNDEKIPFQIKKCHFISRSLFVCHWDAAKICMELCLSFPLCSKG